MSHKLHPHGPVILALGAGTQDQESSTRKYPRIHRGRGRAGSGARLTACSIVLNTTPPPPHTQRRTVLSTLHEIIQGSCGCARACTTLSVCPFNDASTCPSTTSTNAMVPSKDAVISHCPSGVYSTDRHCRRARASERRERTGRRDSARERERKRKRARERRRESARESERARAREREFVDRGKQRVRAGETEAG